MNNKVKVAAEVSQKDECVEAPDFGLILNLEVGYIGLSRKANEANCTNTEAALASVNNLNLKEEHHMTREEFWEIINSTLEAKDQKEQFKLIKAEVSKRNAAEILTFSEIMRGLQCKSARWEIWGAGRIIKGYCFGKNFESFLLWIISKGQSVYEKALINPDSLAGVITQRDIDESVSFGRLSHIAWEVYEEKTGKRMKMDRRSHFEVEDYWNYDDFNEMSVDFDVDLHSNMGKRWNFYDLHEMDKRYPNLLPAFLDCYLHLEKKLLKGKILGCVNLTGELSKSHNIIII